MSQDEEFQKFKFINDMDWPWEYGKIYDIPVDGIFQAHWSNGNLRYEWYYKDGKRAGTLKQITNYKNGKKDGPWIAWWYNGVKWYERTYKDGEKDGLWVEWYENERKAAEETYKDGKRHGLRTRWYGSGEKKSKKTFKDGEMISEKQYNKKNG
jgi:antitoxin component YwqK of YwqJK toxin-antitoxin module